MKRREFIAGLGGVVAWPRAANAQRAAMPVQQGVSVRRIAVLQAREASDNVYLNEVAVFSQALKNLGWIEGTNLQVDLRFGGDDPDRLALQAAELVRAAPAAIVVVGTLAQQAALRETHSIPIVVAVGGDPVASRIVGNIARPEGNVTGMATLEPSIAGKWVELLKEVAPDLTRIAILSPANTGAPMYLPAIDAAVAKLGVQALPMPIRSADEIARAIETMASGPNGGIVVAPPPLSMNNRKMLIELAAQRRVPVIYFRRDDVVEGGLISYGNFLPDLYRGAASYVDRILRGAKPGDLPIQFPTRFELVVNLRTAKAMGLIIPEAFLLRADEVIE